MSTSSWKESGSRVMHEIVPPAATIAALVGTPRTRPPSGRQTTSKRRLRSLGRRVRILKAATEREIDERIYKYGQEDIIGALFVAADLYFCNPTNPDRHARGATTQFPLSTRGASSPRPVAW